MSAIHNKRSTPDKDRERMKELDRMRRHEMHTTMKKEKADNAPLFGNPVKVAKPVDDMSKMIHNTLGSYETVKDQLTERSNYLLLGIPKQPQTPVVGKGNDEIFTDVRFPSGVTHNGTDLAMNQMAGGCSVASSVKMKTETKPKSADHKASRKKSHRSSERKMSVDKNKVKKHASHHSSSTAETNVTAALVDIKHSSDSVKKKKDDKTSSLVSSHTVSPPRTESKHSHSSGSRVETDHFMKSPKETTPIKKEENLPPPYPRQSLFIQMKTEITKVISPLKDEIDSDNDSSKISTPSPANTAKPSTESTSKTTFNGLIVESENHKSDIISRQGRMDKASMKKTLPHLKLPPGLNNQQGEGIQIEVENILKEMTYPIDPLLTAIQTPSKGGEPAKFPFPAQQCKESHVSQLFTHTKTTDPSIVVKSNKMVPSTLTQAPDLSADLLISDDDSDDEKAVEGRHTVTENTATMRHSPATRPRTPSSSNSGSSSSESEDESSSGSESDSESSSSDNASPSPSPVQKEPMHKLNWSLGTFFNAAATQKTKASPGSASQNNKCHQKAGNVSSNLSNRETASAARNSPGKLSEYGDSSNGFDIRDFSDADQQGFDPGGGMHDPDQVEKNKPNGLIKLKVKVPSKTISKGKSPGKASTSKSNVKSPANKSGKKMSSIKKSSVGKAAESGCGSKTTPVKGKTKDSKSKTNKQSTKSHEKKTDVKPRTPKQSTPKSDKPSTPKQSDKKSKKPAASSGKGEKYYKSKAFVSEDSDSDSDASIDVVNTSSPDKSLQNTSIKSVSSLSSSSSSLTMTPSHTKSSKSTPSKTKTKDKSSSGKKSSEKAKVEINTGIKVVISEIGKDVALPEPLLSPIQNEDFRHMPTLTPTKPFLASSACQQLSKIEYVNGIPSLVVKLDLSLITRVPTKVTMKKETEESLSFSGNPTIITSNVVEEKPPKLKKIQKRRQEQRKDEKAECETKKIKKEHDIISKSPTIEKPEPEHNEIGVKQEDSHEWDRKHPRRLSERRSSNSSIQSTNSVKKEKDSPPRKKTKRDHSISDTKHDNKLKRRDWDTPEIRTIQSESPKALSLNTAHQSNGHKAGNDWSTLAAGVHVDCPERRHQERKPIKTEFDEKQYPADHYCAEAKELKHQADAMVDKIAKALTYVDAVLSFIKCSNAIETDSESKSSPFNMYSETSDLIKYIMRYTVNHGLDTGGIDKKLAVLCMRCQALLCNKMFKLKKENAMKFSKILADYFKTPTKPANAQAPSPYQANWNAKSTTGTPSPMSPTPSPAGSIGSVGSLSSNNGDGYLSVTPGSSARMTNGLATPSASHATVTIPQRIHSIMQQHTMFTNYLLLSHDLWEQADELQKENEEFFRGLDIECGHLTFHSSILDLVRYVRLGLHRLRSIATGLW